MEQEAIFCGAERDLEAAEGIRGADSLMWLKPAADQMAEETQAETGWQGFVCLVPSGCSHSVTVWNTHICPDSSIVSMGCLSIRSHFLKLVCLAKLLNEVCRGIH